MELKRYQQQVLSDIRHFNEQLSRTPYLSKAYREYWASRGVSLVAGDQRLHEYENSVKGVPRVTVKVPTAGGKTFIACNAVKTIFDSLPEGKPQVVAWFVPLDTIQKQTYRRLSDPTDPYRQRLDLLFGGRVRVYDKDSLLAGQGFNPTIVGEQLTIMVLSIQSFATRKKDDLRSWRENENLAPFTATYTDATPRIADADETSLMQVIASLNPLVIIDESHNFTADLRVETLRRLNPRYILELTAAPKETSNIVSYIDASQLKQEEMVKLPVVVVNSNSVADVIGDACRLRQSLEAKAREAEGEGGDYVRPIVLFQAQSNTGDDMTTFDRVKADLMELGIAEEEIKIKVAGRDEIKDTDLMSRTCPVRYIITVDALREGWDCPFAYILASLANRTSRISVEQILGRILRQPHSHRQPDPMLNASYVFTCSADFGRTLDTIVESLNNSGFSGRDYVVDASLSEERGVRSEEWATQQLPFKANNSSLHTPHSSQENDSSLENGVTQGYSEEEVKFSPEMARSTVIRYEEQRQHTESTEKEYPDDIMERVKSYPMRDIIAHEARAIMLPQFYYRNDVGSNDLFKPAATESLLEQNYLLSGFDLSTQDRNINFQQTKAPAVAIDIEERNKGEYVPMMRSMSETKLAQFAKLYQSFNDDGKIDQLSRQLFNMLKDKSNAIAPRQLRDYIRSVVELQPPHMLESLGLNLLNTKLAFEGKIKELANAYKRQQFDKLLASGKVFVKPTFSLPEAIVPRSTLKGIPNGLYCAEEDVNGFERNVIFNIADLPNVSFWHRNLERGKGFCINGFINHYPDFLVVLRNGMTLLIEVKGDYLDGSDSANKLYLGNRWASKAGDRYRYFMVFEKNKIDGAFTLSELKDIINDMG